MAAVSLLPLAAPAIAKETTVRYTLSWLPTGSNSSVYISRQLGYWKQRGLDVEITRGYGSNAALQAVSTGQFDFGNAGTGAMLLSIIKGLKLSSVNTLTYDSGIGIIVLEKSDIKKPADLAGRKIAATAAGSDTPFLPAYFKRVGLPEDSVKIVYVDAQIIEESVIRGEVDGQVAVAASSVPKFVSQNIPMRFFPIAAQGLKMYGSSTTVSNKYLEQNHSVADAFSEGMLEGLKFSLLNPKETVDRFLKEQEEIALTRNARLFAELGLGIATALAIAPESADNSLGYTDLKQLGEQAELVRDCFQSEKNAALPQVATYASNDLIGKIALTPAEWAQVRANAAPYAKYVGRTA
ncbi:MAG TPA: ABC transporter substrate-binding protein [Stellaceae bacterium]|nr:ABC transporter substrate-binding protein [Stellaceae bacterium]